MAYRKVGSTLKLAATNTPQPMLGSWVTAATGSFATAPAGSPVTLTLGTASVSGNDAANIFIPGEPAWLQVPSGAAAPYISGSGETVLIKSVSGNTVTLGNQTDISAQGGPNPVTRASGGYPVGALGTGAYLFPKQMSNNFLVVFEDGGTGTFLYIGCDYRMTATAYRVFKLAKTATGVQPAYYSSAMFSPGNPFDISELFVFGTANDVFNVSVVID
jgi:hypothetical protein